MSYCCITVDNETNKEPTSSCYQLSKSSSEVGMTNDPSIMFHKEK